MSSIGCESRNSAKRVAEWDRELGLSLMLDVLFNITGQWDRLHPRERVGFETEGKCSTSLGSQIWVSVLAVIYA